MFCRECGVDVAPHTPHDCLEVLRALVAKLRTLNERLTFQLGQCRRALNEDYY